jgi:hypothetical protein
MKKTLLFALVLGLAVMFAVPAFAFKIEGAKDTNFYFGALMYTDIGAWHRDENLGPQKKDRTEMILNVPRHSRVRGSLEVGKVGGYFELREGGDRQTAQFPNGTFAGGAYFVESAKLYGWYKFGNCQILAGKTDGHVFSVTAYQNLGFQNNNHIAGFGWGSIYDQRDSQIRFSQDISKMIGYDISLVQPQYYTDSTIQSYATFPLVAAKVRLNFGVVSLMPAGYYQYVKWDNLPAGFDDNMSSWFTVLPVVVRAGAFTGTFQAGYGQNIASPLALQNAFHQYQRVAGKIKNTTGLNGFVDLAFAAGPVTPHVYVGYDKAENTDVYVGDKYNVRMMYGVGVNWKIADSFYIVPEFTYYDYGKSPTVAGNPDIGKEWLAGVQFQFVF